MFRRTSCVRECVCVCVRARACACVCEKERVSETEQQIEANITIHAPKFLTRTQDRRMCV